MGDTIGELWIQTPILTSFALRRFVRIYIRNTKTTVQFYADVLISNECSTIAGVYFLCYTWNRDTNGELRLQTRIAVSF